MNLLKTLTALCVFGYVGQCWSWEGSREIIAPSPEFPTIQSAVDAVRSGGVVTIAEGRWEEVVRIENKDLTLKGQYQDYNRRSILSNDRFTPFCIEIAGKSSVIIDELTVEGCFQGIYIRPIGRLLSDVKISRLRSSQSVMGLYGSARSLEIRNSGLHNNKGHGAIIYATEKLLLDTVGFSGNLGYGLIVKNDVSPLLSQISRSQHHLRRVTTSYNGFGGVFLSRLNKSVLVELMGGNQNRGSHLTIRESRSVKISSSSFNYATYDNINGQADGIRILSSDVIIQNTHIDENEGRGLAVYGCTGNPREYSNVMVWNSTSSLNLANNWISGLAGNCQPNPIPLFIVDEGGNSCLDSSGVNIKCDAVFERISSFEEAP